MLFIAIARIDPTGKWKREHAKGAVEVLRDAVMNQISFN